MIIADFFLHFKKNPEFLFNGPGRWITHGMILKKPVVNQLRPVKKNKTSKFYFFFHDYFSC